MLEALVKETKNKKFGVCKIFFIDCSLQSLVATST
jgi:hypothetical protein